VEDFRLHGRAAARRGGISSGQEGHDERIRLRSAGPLLRGSREGEGCPGRRRNHGAGVCASIDTGLYAVELLRGAEAAKTIQERMEYPYYRGSGGADIYRVQPLG